MGVSPEAIKSLRARTGAGVVDCKTALLESGGDEERAITILRERGKIRAAKKAGRATGDGAIGIYLHTNKKVAALVAVRCETDFVARSAPFQELAKDLAMQVAAMDPIAVSTEDLPDTIARDGAELSSAPGSGGAQHALLTQAFIKDPQKTVNDVIAEKVTELGENIVVAEFQRLAL